MGAKKEKGERNRGVIFGLPGEAGFARLLTTMPLVHFKFSLLGITEASGQLAFFALDTFFPAFFSNATTPGANIHFPNPAGILNF